MVEKSLLMIVEYTRILLNYVCITFAQYCRCIVVIFEEQVLVFRNSCDNNPTEHEIKNNVVVRVRTEQVHNIY